MVRIDKAVAELFAGLRQLLRDIFYRLGAERRRRRIAELDELVAWAVARGLTPDQIIVFAKHMGYRRHAKALAELIGNRPRRPLLPPTSQE